MELKPIGKSYEGKREFTIMVDENGEHYLQTFEGKTKYTAKFNSRKSSDEETEAEKAQREKAVVDLLWNILLENINNGVFMKDANGTESSALEENASGSDSADIK